MQKIIIKLSKRSFLVMLVLGCLNQIGECSFFKVETNVFRSQNIEVSFEIYGNIEGRKVVEQFVPFNKELFSPEVDEKTVLLRIIVMPNGNVDKTIMVERSSGNKEIDGIATRCAGLFQFGELGDTLPQNNAEGFIEFKIKTTVQVDDKNSSPITTSQNNDLSNVLQNRPILKKYLPVYPRWAEEKGVETEVAVHFAVTPNGRVCEVRAVKPSPYSDFTELAIKAMRAYKFEPLSQDEPQIVQEGETTLNFRLKK